MRKAYNNINASKSLTSSKKYNFFDDHEEKKEQLSTMPQQSPVEKFLEKCSSAEINTIFEFFEAVKLTPSYSSSTLSVIKSLQKILPVTKQSKPCTDDYLADSSSNSQRNDSLKENPLQNSVVSPL